ncbi:unnamed protein product [Echinostoma caproni]|uniref:BRCT domain-containing protein n=1 Tax=Echinostoma caproni TaxID=27848 RepID=A0A183AQP1_9TREM|nr:unnamed protein product [Echinostoma caproni]
MKYIASPSPSSAGSPSASNVSNTKLSGASSNPNTAPKASTSSSKSDPPPTVAAGSKSSSKPNTANKPSTCDASTSGQDSKPENTGSRRGPLTGVVFSLSGYQNPLRSELRKKALDLGARFRQDWGKDCTHLICAFATTPKFKEVVGKGIIVSEKWIEKCYDTKSKVDWRPFRVGRAPSPPSSSSSKKATTEEERDSDSSSETPEIPRSQTKLKRRSHGKSNNTDDEWLPDAEGSDPGDSEESDEGSDYEAEEDEEENDSSEEEEEEDEEEEKKGKRGKRKRKTKSGGSKKSKVVHKNATPNPSSNVMQPSTVDKSESGEDSDTAKSESKDTNGSDTRALVELPNLFENKHFFVHNKAIPLDEERLVQRLIVAFAG